MKPGEQHVWRVTGMDKSINWHVMYFLTYEDAVNYYSQLSRWWRKCVPVVVVNHQLVIPK